MNKIDKERLRSEDNEWKFQELFRLPEFRLTELTLQRLTTLLSVVTGEF